MNKQTLTTLISVVLVLFVLVKILADQFCAPTPNNVVAQAVTSVVSGPSTAPSPHSPDPLSWEPALRQVLALFLKACSH
jgi:hypothetical protein